MSNFLRRKSIQFVCCENEKINQDELNTFNCFIENQIERKFLNKIANSAQFCRYVSVCGDQKYFKCVRSKIYLNEIYAFCVQNAYACYSKHKFTIK